MRSRMVALSLAVAFAAGCADTEEVRVGDEDVAASAAASSAAPAAGALTDPQIAHVAVTANSIDIEAGQMAEEKAESDEVEQFAQTMIRDHTAVNERAGALAQRLGVTPEDNPVSQSLLSDAATARQSLEGLSGAEFDRAYIEREVGYHQAVLDALDQTLIPGATNEELRALLTEVRPAIAAHLEHARTLQTSLGGTR